ncbi:aminodeoxychorismate synthase component I [Mobilicoccus sp.]|uniref:aminodeoxychorismate synthase component I n=1 Tax=Mobilicoccus sp. TaxID=2034349 RepID=UPI0028B1B393|nr:aminodeoxychorismate synthase component I [Mobilicoccus sp.]
MDDDPVTRPAGRGDRREDTVRVLVVDNHDSFTGNLVHDIARVTGRVPDVVLADATPPDPLEDWLGGYDAVVVSPGPGTPENPADLGLSAAVVRQAEVPVLGVCLGMQALAHAAGARVVRAPSPVHGEIGDVRHDGSGLFAGLPDPLPMVRYHSLVVTDLPETLVVDATSDGLVMALHHRDRPLWGIQTHPESICSVGGRDLMRTFLQLADRWNADRRRGTQDRAGTGSGAVEGDRSTEADRPSAQERSLTTTGGGPSGASVPAPSPGRRWQAVATRVGFSGSAEDVYEAVFRGEAYSWWLDSATAPGAGGVSACGSGSGPLARIATVDGDGHLVVHDASGVPFADVGDGDVLDVVASDLGVLEVEVVDVGVVDAADGAGPRGFPGPDTREGGAGFPLPFQPGWVGYIGYEEACAMLLPGDAPAVDAGGPPRAVLVRTDRLVALDHVGAAWVVALVDTSCEREQRAWLRATAATLDALVRDTTPDDTTPDRADVVAVAEADADADVDALASVDVVDVTLRHDRAAYLDLIARAQEFIAAGESYELCLTNRIDVAAAPDPFALYRRLRETSPRPFAAYLDLGGTQVLSASPERFLRVRAEGGVRRVEAKPIKGTRRRGTTPAEDATLAEELRTDVKERAENLMIVDLLRHDLSRVCTPGTVEVPLLFDVETHAGVHQLVSTITGDLAADRTPVDAIRAALPGGSMTGAPKERSVRLLRELEGGPRGVYSGVLGYVSVTGVVDLSIVIRTVVAHGGRLTYGVGGAITARSDPAAEWHETSVKAGTLARALDVDLGPVFEEDAAFGAPGVTPAAPDDDPDGGPSLDETSEGRPR